MDTQKEVERLYEEACELALAEVERLARQILRKRKSLGEFVMSMGMWCFTNKSGDVISHEIKSGYDNYTSRTHYAPLAWAKPLDGFIDKWDDYLKLTGEPMRFTAEGEVIRMW